MSRPYVVPLDTTLEAARVYFATLKKLGPERRVQMAVELTRSMRRGVEAGVRMRHPEYTEDEVRLAVLRLMVGDELFRQCCPGCTIAP
jgi:hypothetical protein